MVIEYSQKYYFHRGQEESQSRCNAALAYIKDAPSFRDVGAVFSSVNITYLLLCTNDKKDESSIFEKALVELNVSQIITRIFVHFSTPPNDTFRYAEGILNNSLQIILSLLESPRGFAQAPSMLKLGLLDGIANYTSNFYRTARSTVDPLGLALTTIVGNILPHYFIHYAVIGSAIEATKGLIQSKKSKALEKSIISSEWQLFVDLLLERASIKALYDINLKNKNHLVCHNVRKRYC